jgi:hypothetical protein
MFGDSFFEQAFGGRMGGGPPGRQREPADTEKYYNLLGVDKKATHA